MLDSDMRKFVINLLIFFVIVACCDYGLGALLGYMRSHAGSGSVMEMEYTSHTSTDDVLIFGSSRAMHHYSPQVITDSLGLSCFNCGRDGMGIFYHYGRWLLASEHHLPKLIIYDICEFDFEKDSRLKYLSELKPYYDHPGMAELFQDVDSMEQYKVKSRLYRNNSKLLQLISGYLKKVDRTNGFVPQGGLISRFGEGKKKEKKVDLLKCKYLEKFILSCKNHDVKLIFMVSPYYHGKWKQCPKEVTDLFEKYDIDFYNNENAEGFTGNNKYFRDIKHLNATGAKAYTQFIISEIKQSLRK